MRKVWVACIVVACRGEPSTAPVDAAASAPPVAVGTAPSTGRGPRRYRVDEDKPQPEVAPVAPAYASGDAAYREPDCEKLEDVSALRDAHVAGRLRATVEGLARARYPTGLAFLRAQDDAQLGAWFRRVPETFEGVVSRFDAAVHEGSHVWRAKRFDPRREKEVFPVRSDLVIETRHLATFPRSEIIAEHVDAAADPYVKIYLEGASGTQGFETVLDEYQAYAHSLAARYCTRDLIPRGQRVSARDGILTFMYYVEVYLAVARARHPKAYADIMRDAGHRRMILAVWDRAEFWLRKSRDEQALGVGDGRIATWVYEASRLAEIASVRERDGGSE